jgi:hypothetical protein
MGKVDAILESLVMKTPGISYFKEGVCTPVTFMTLTMPVIILTVMKFCYERNAFHAHYTIFHNHAHCFLIFATYCTILHLAYGGGITTGYRLEARVGSLQGNDFSLLCSVQTGSGAYPASNPMGTGG